MKLVVGAVKHFSGSFQIATRRRRLLVTVVTDRADKHTALVRWIIAAIFPEVFIHCRKASKKQVATCLLTWRCLVQNGSSSFFSWKPSIWHQQSDFIISKRQLINFINRLQNVLSWIYLLKGKQPCGSLFPKSSWLQQDENTSFVSTWLLMNNWTKTTRCWLRINFLHYPNQRSRDVLRYVIPILPSLYEAKYQTTKYGKPKKRNLYTRRTKFKHWSAGRQLSLPESISVC